MMGLISSVSAVFGLAFMLLGQEGGLPDHPMRARDLFLEGSRAPVASADVRADPPLALRYTILKFNEGRGFVAVDPLESFQSGDRIRLRMEVNNNGYLYVIHRGSSGFWTALFPSKDLSPSMSNAVKKGGIYEIPAGLSWAFDQKPGVERLFIVFSRQEQPSLEGLVDSVRDEPDSKSGADSKGYLVESQAPPMGGRIDDEVVVQMTRLHSRDLKLETVNEKDDENNTVPAVYVANPSGESDAVVLKELNLIHK
jgi:hypothetical protein